MLAIACNAAAAEEAEDGQLPGSSSEAEAIGEAVPLLAAVQASSSSSNGRWVRERISLERACNCTRVLSQPFICRLWLGRQSLLRALKAKQSNCRALPLWVLCVSGTNEELSPLHAPHHPSQCISAMRTGNVSYLEAAKAIGSLSAQKLPVTCRPPARSPSPRPGALHSTGRAAADPVQIIAGRCCHPITLLCPVPHSLMQGPSYSCTTGCNGQLCSTF